MTKPTPRCTTGVPPLHVCKKSFDRFLTKSYGGIFRTLTKPIPRCTTRVPPLHVCKISFGSAQYFWRSATETRLLPVSKKKMSIINKVLMRHIFEPWQNLYPGAHLGSLICTYTKFHLDRPSTFGDLRRKRDPLPVSKMKKKCRFLTKSYGDIFRTLKKPIPRCTTRAPPLHVCKISFESVQYLWRSMTETRPHTSPKDEEKMSILDKVLRRHFSNPEKTYTQVHN